MTERLNQRICIKFCCKLGHSSAETVRMIRWAFREDAMSNGQIKMWYRRFKDGRESVKSDSRSGRPSRRTSENVNRVRVAINENPRLTIRKLGEALGIPRTVVNVILTEDLGMSHVPAKFGDKLEDHPKDETSVKEWQHTSLDVDSVIKEEFCCVDVDEAVVKKEFILEESEITLPDISNGMEQETIEDGSQPIVHSVKTEKVFLNEPDPEQFIDECSADPGASEIKGTIIEESNFRECTETKTGPQEVISCVELKIQPNTNKSRKKHECDKCNKRFCFSGDLSRHKLKHSGLKRHKCDICNKAFTVLSDLKTHKEIHSEIKNYLCDVCGKAFAQLCGLTKHKRIHSGLKNFVCEVCNKTFRSSSNLTEHKLIHNNVKKHQCEICNKAFTQSGVLSKHKATHSEIKNAFCDICNKTFSLPCYLKQHKLIHSGIKRFKCNICNKAFTLSTNLSQHKLLHSGIKRYQCDVCNKAFALSSHLAQHKLVHSGTKNYQCDVCTMAFTRKSNLSRHKLMYCQSK